MLKFRIFCPNFLKWPNYHWIYSNLCNQCLLPLKLWVRTHLWRGELNTTLCHKVCQWLATGQWFSPGTPVSSTNKTDRQDITEIFLKLALNIVTKIVQALPLIYWSVPSNLYIFVFVIGFHMHIRFMVLSQLAHFTFTFQLEIGDNLENPSVMF